MAKHAEKNTLLSVSYIGLPLLLVLTAAVLWFAGGATSGASGGPAAALSSHAGNAVGGNNRALDQLVKIVRDRSPGGQAGTEARAIVSSEQRLRAFNDAHETLSTTLAATRAQLADVSYEPAVQSVLAGLDALDTQLLAIRGAPEQAEALASSANQTVTDMSMLIAALNGARDDIDVAPLADTELSALLSEQMIVMRSSADAMLADAQALSRAGAAAKKLQTVAARSNGPDGVVSPITTLIAPFMPWLALGLLGVALLLVAVLIISHRKDAELRRIALEQTDQNERNQQAILRLLDELGSLADGDLTVEATVTEDITGAIADSINYAIEALRELVTTIDGTAAMVDSATRQTENTAIHMNRAAQKQTQEISAATESIAAIAASIEEVSGNAERSSDVARHSVDVAHKGGDAVRRTIEGMNTIRETIQETSKRIKRLGESSQEIGNIVELINDIAEQTNILALNASIQASMAGEAGRGFAVVADEVQRLAERSTNATKQIEVLVRTIQADTNEAVVSMERSTTDVVGGALLAENAGAALDEIEQVSNQIASLVQNIYGSARQQSQVASDINRRTSALKEISSQTGKATSATTSSIGKLAQLAGELRKSVSGFRLPEAANVTRISRDVDKPNAADAVEREAS